MLYELVRYDKGDSTPGKLFVEGVVFDVEGLPWKNNERGVSCIEDGLYEYFVDYSNNKSRWVVELKPRNGRSQIQFHYARDLSRIEGCFRHETKELEEFCKSLMAEAGIIRITTIGKPLIQE